MPRLTIEDLKRIREEAKQTLTLRSGEARAKVTVHMGTCGISAGAREVMAALLKEIETQKRHRRDRDHVGLCRTVQPGTDGDRRTVRSGPGQVRGPEAGENGAGVQGACAGGKIVADFALASGCETTG